MNRCTQLLWMFGLSLVASGCATSFDIGKADPSVTPREAAQNPALVQKREVAWGGTIVNGKNLNDNTQLEVVAYPLDDNNRPRPDGGPQGRVLIIHPGYLETADYAPGRQVTVVGVVTETRSGKVGEAPYTYPVVTATRLHLWPRETQQQQTSEPRFHFG